MSPDGLSNRTRALGAAFKTIGAGLVVAMLLLLIRGDIREQEQREDIRRVLGVLVECTTDPAERKDATVKVGEDDCFVRSRKRFDALASQIGDVSVIAAACGAANPGDVPGTRRCVEKALAE